MPVLVRGRLRPALSRLIRDEVWLRQSARLGSTTGRINWGNDSLLNGWSDATYMLRLKPTALVSGRGLVAKSGASGAPATHHLLVSGTGGQVQAQRDWSGTDANYITSDAPLVLNQWTDLIVVYRNSTSASISIYAAPSGRPPRERSYGTSTNGSGTIGTADSSNNLVIGNRTIGAGLCANADYALSVAIRRALTYPEILQLCREPRDFRDDPDCWVFGISGWRQFDLTSVSAINLSRRAIESQIGNRQITAGGSNAWAVGPGSPPTVLGMLRKFWAVEVAVGGGADQISGTAAGSATAAGTLSGRGALVGSAAGVATAAGTLVGTGALAGASAGVATTSGVLTARGALAGTTAGVATAVGTLLGRGALVGSSAGTATVTGDLYDASAAGLRGTAAGTSTVAGTLRGTGALAGSAAGVATVTGTLRGPGQVSGLTAGAATVTGTLLGRGRLVGFTAGTATAAGTISALASIVGTAAGVATVAGSIRDTAAIDFVLELVDASLPAYALVDRSLPVYQLTDRSQP